MSNLSKIESEELIKHFNSLTKTDQNEINQLILSKEIRKSQDRQIFTMTDTDHLKPLEDRFNRHSFAQMIASQLSGNSGMTTYSINGPWGCGKSVLMQWVKEDLDSQFSGKVKTLWFNPWKYERLGNIVLPLIQEMNTLAVGKDFDKKINDALKKVTLGVGLGIGAAIVSKWFGLKIAWEVLKGSRRVLTNKRDLENEFKVLTDLHNDYQDLINYICKAYSIDKIVFFVDDLDRCTPDQAIVLLESIKNFLYAEKAVFVFAIDKRVIAQGIKVKYGSLTEIDGEEYLEKIIHFSYDVPVDIRACADALINIYQVNLAGFEADLQFAPNLFQIASIESIRTVKKVLNRYGLIRQISRQSKLENYDPRMLFVISFLHEYSPEFFNLMLQATPRNLVIEAANFDSSIFSDESKLVGRGLFNYNFANLIRYSKLREICYFIKNNIVIGGIQEETQRRLKFEQFDNDLPMYLRIVSSMGSRT